jgi:hypothetical protein
MTVDEAARERLAEIGLRDTEGQDEYFRQLGRLLAETEEPSELEWHHSSQWPPTGR